MKILVIGRFFEEGIALFIAEELARMGHEVLRFDPGPIIQPYGGRLRFYWGRLRREVLQTLHQMRTVTGREVHGPGLRKVLAAAGEVDLVFSTHDYLSPADSEAVKAQTRAPLILWYPDPVWSFKRHMFLNASYDMLFFKDPYLVHMIRSKLGKRVYYLPECYSPHSLDPSMAEEPVDPAWATDICIAGNLYAYRVALFQQLAETHDMKIWGLPAPLWMRTGALEPKLQNRFVAHADKARAFRGAKIVLNTLNPSEIWGTNLRTFEACGAGAFQIVDWRPGLGQLFEIGTEVEVFTDTKDLRSKIDRYLAAPEERDMIARAGHVRAARDHTYRVRLEQLLDVVDGRTSGYPEPVPAWQMPGS
ncbi:spore maturation protein CgeB [Roseinatronobacter thiooxidans]|uniref:Spore maturation protein CgeB n=1 Tax=Roseinatronobacter thiooxidans TaxID=121821 RepID=A0A2W7QAP5_9RHOB|nr:glycosyltransferase [Roseinatronobacter thiooxidans]PZX45758.1 spore maturation protein CgeB [Roseinatronobacter thiooxidans]